MDELKPCPFCGGGIEEVREAWWCNHCRISIAIGGMVEWNTRPIEEALRARIKELEERVDG